LTIVAAEFVDDRIQSRMTKKVYIAVGNHRSFAGIKEIVYSIQSALSDQFSVELSRELKGGGVNIVIDEFSGLFDVSAVKQVTELYPGTKIVVVATEFATSVSVLGMELMRTFNFFGAPLDWGRLLRETLRSLAGGMPPYMRQRYVGFANVLKHCSLLTAIHPLIVPTATELARGVAPALPAPLMVYPIIGPLSDVQRDRLWNLPAGFVMTGTRTPYRIAVSREIVRKFKRAGWSKPLYEHRAFEGGARSASSNEVREVETLDSLLNYDSARPDVLFNVNPPQSAKWAYSSPMRILRAALLGQIPLITKRFHDHPLEDVAALWDGSLKTAVDLASRQFVDRRIWLPDYLRAIEAYDRKAKDANKPFVDAVDALAEDSASAPLWDSQQNFQMQSWAGRA
jgi:hypothetical protein